MCFAIHGEIEVQNDLFLALLEKYHDKAFWLSIYIEQKVAQNSSNFMCVSWSVV